MYTKKPTQQSSPRRRAHKVGKNIQLITYDGRVVEKQVWDGTHWIDVDDSNIEYLLLKEIFRLKAKVRALSPTRRGRT